MDLQDATAQTVYVPAKEDLEALRRESDQTDIAAQQLDQTVPDDDAHAISRKLPAEDLAEIVDKGMTPGD
jgi:hypothetical protein